MVALGLARYIYSIVDNVFVLVDFWVILFFVLWQSLGLSDETNNIISLQSMTCTTPKVKAKLQIQDGLVIC